jgi:hypothetical protein
MTDDQDDWTDDIVDSGLPAPHILATLGAINLLWSRLDALIAGALFSLLQVEGIELTILLGRTDSKLEKMLQILKHRNDKERLSYVQKLKSQLDRLRRDRNALTHGDYQGRASRGGEEIFYTPVDIIFDEEGGTYSMRDFTHEQMQAHANEVAQIIAELPTHFDADKMYRLHTGKFRVR